MQKTYAWLLFILVLSVNTYSQKYNFKQFSINEGLSQSQVFTITQDNLGRMWFGTTGGGITIYDGSNTSYYNVKNALPSFSILSSHTVDTGIWLGLDKAVLFYDGLAFNTYPYLKDINGQVTHIVAFKNDLFVIENQDRLSWFKNEKLYFQKSNVYSVNQVNDNQVLLFTRSSGILNYQDEVLDSNYLSELDDVLIPQSTQKSNSNTLVLGGVGVLYTYENHTLDSVVLESEGLITALVCDKNDNVWVGHEYNGIDLIKKDTIIHISTENGLPSNCILDIFEDNSGNIWISFDGLGVAVFSGFQFTSYLFEKFTDHAVILDVFIDSKNRTWVSLEGKGIVLWDAQGKSLLGKEAGLSNVYVNVINEDKFGNIWFGHSNGVSAYHNGKITNFHENDSGRTGNIILSSFSDNEGNMWFGSYFDGLSYFDGKEFHAFNKDSLLSISQIWDIYQTKAGQFWIATNNGLFNFYDDHIFHYTEQNGLPHNSVGTILPVNNECFWFGTEAGLSYFDGAEFHNISTEQGLTSSMIYTLSFLNDSTLVSGSEKGIDLIGFSREWELLSVSNFGKNEGFSGIECNMNAIARDAKNNLWLGTMDGLFCFNPQKQVRQQRNLYISDIQLFFENTDWKTKGFTLKAWNHIPENLELPADENTLSFHFSTNDFINPDQIRYQFMIDGLNKTWLPATKENKISLSNINPGLYEFNLRAFNQDTSWVSESIAYPFKIIPPFYKTSGFYFIIVFVLFVLLLIIIKIRESNLKNREKNLIKEVELRTTTINEQKNEISQQHKLLQNAFQSLIEINKINQQIIKNLELNKLINTVYIHISKLMDVGGFGIGVYNEHRNCIGFENYIEKDKVLEYAEDSILEVSNLTAWCFMHQKDVLITNYDEDIKAFNNQIRRPEHGEKSLSIIYTPLTTNKPLGVMTVQSFKKNAYTKQHLEILKNIAVFTAIAIDNADAYKNIELQKNEISEQTVELTSMIEELRTTNELIEEQNIQLTQLSHVVSNTDNAILITNAKGIIEWVNDGFTKFYGYTYDEFTSKSTNIFELSSQKKIHKAIESVIKTKKAKSYEASLKHKNGNLLHVQTTWTPILNDEDQLIKLVAIDSDISKLKQTEAQVKRNNEEIKASINYAKYLQQAIFPKKNYIREVLPNSFVFFKPRDIVSGDFYYIKREGAELIVAVADCTGHGVPGAMMSILGISKLSEIVRRYFHLNSSEILDELRVQIKESLSQTGEILEAKDGIDIALCKINFESRVIDYCGAKSPLLIVRKNADTKLEPLFFKPDKQPVGIYPNEKPFKNYKIDLFDQDKIYMFTDGYIDQLGGPNREKFMIKSFKKLLIESSTVPMLKQKSIIEETLNNWKGECNQIDDILVFGFEI